MRKIWVKKIWKRIALICIKQQKFRVFLHTFPYGYKWISSHYNTICEMEKDSNSPWHFQTTSVLFSLMASRVLHQHPSSSYSWKLRSVGCQIINRTTDSPSQILDLIVRLGRTCCFWWMFIWTFICMRHLFSAIAIQWNCCIHRQRASLIIN